MGSFLETLKIQFLWGFIILNDRLTPYLVMEVVLDFLFSQIKRGFGDPKVTLHTTLGPLTPLFI